MHSLMFRLVSCLVGLTLLPSAVAAQDWGQPWSDPRDRPPRVDVSASVGVLAPTDWSDLVLLGSISSASGVLEQVLVRDLRVRPDSTFGGAFTYWQDKYGFRVQTGFSRSSVVIGGTPIGSVQQPGVDEILSVDIDTWFYDVRGAIGLLKYSPERRVWPYAFVGFGGITYDLARTVGPSLLTSIELGSTQRNGRGDIVIVEDDGREFILAIDELGLETVFAVNFGVGTDFRIPFGPAGVGLRLELSDHVAPSPLGLSIRELTPFGGFVSDTAVRFNRVHHLRAAAGLVVQIGR
jgi:hypothetical protein